MSKAVSVDWRFALIAVGLLLAGFAAGYLGHREVIHHYSVVYQTVTQTRVVTEIVRETRTVTETRFLEPRVYLHEPPKGLEVRVDASPPRLKVFVRNVGNETVWRVLVLAFTWSSLYGERVHTARVEEVEPGVTRVVEFFVGFETPVHVVVVRYA